MANPRVWLVGESNPYSRDPDDALLYWPEGSAGDRLCRLVLGMRPDDYLAAFERRNLIMGRRWSMPLARASAAALAWEDGGDDRWILLGRKVAEAWGFGGAPFVRDGRALALPHPSGLNRRAWEGSPGSFRLARDAVSDLAPWLTAALGAAGAA